MRRDNIEAKSGTRPVEEEAAFKVPIEAQYEAQGNPYYASARLWDNGVIAPDDTRMVLVLALSGKPECPDRALGRAAPLRRVPDVRQTEARRCSAPS